MSNSANSYSSIQREISMEVTMKEAEKLVPVSRTTLYNDKKAGVFSVKKNAKSRTVIDIAELQRVYGDLNVDTGQSTKVQLDENEQSSNQNGEVEALKKQVMLLENANKRESEILEDQIEHLKETLSKAQDGHNRATLLLENNTKDKNEDKDWGKSMKAMEARISNQEKSVKEEKELAQKILRQNQALKKALDTERNKSIWKKLFG